MLILSRKAGEKIVVGTDRGRVRVGIDCPREVMILREELIPPPAPGGPREEPAAPQGPTPPGP